MEKTCSVVLLLGPPASGKTTLGKKLADRFGYALFDVGTHMREHMPPEADADSFALHAVGQALANENKVIMSGFPKWKHGLDHLKSCRAKLDMAIILAPVSDFCRLPQSCADILALRADERHRKGERPEDDHANFQMRLKTYETNAEEIVEELTKMGVRTCNINPIDTHKAVEDAAVFEWSIQMPGDAHDALELLLAQASSSSKSATAHNAPTSLTSVSPGFSMLSGGSEAKHLYSKEEVHLPAARGRSPLPGSSKGAWERRDPSEADIEVSLCLPSGDELLRQWVTARSPVRALKTALINAGETKFDFDLCYMGQQLCDTDMISECNGFHSGDVITVVRKEKPPPPPPPRASWDGNCHCTHGRCFTPDSVVRVLQGGVEVKRFFKEVKVGDMVRTGPGEGLGFFRRVQRVWKHLPHPSDEPLPAYDLAEGCRITIGHPALVNGIWRRPETICKEIASFETVVYQLEVEGHIDTVLVGSSSGVVCALLGCYCGEDFGWNVFTRKTVRCDNQPCKKCSKAYIPGHTFDHTKITSRMLEARYEPY